MPNRLVSAEIVSTSGDVLPAGETGLLRCRGPGVCSEYYGNDVSVDAAERLEDGWCYTGDLADFDADGFLYIRGRADDLIIKGGVNIYPQVLETELLKHPQVLEAAIVGMDSTLHGQSIIAFVKAEKLTNADLAAHCMQLLPANAAPDRFYFVDEFPRTAAGKIRKKELLKNLNPEQQNG